MSRAALSTIAAEFTRAGWGDTAAGELAEIHQRLQAERHIAAVQQRIAERAALLPNAPAGHASTSATPPAGHEGPRPPWVRLGLLAIVTCVLWLSACGGGNELTEVDRCKAEFVGPFDPEDHPCERIASDVPTPRLDCAARPELCS